MDMEKVINYLTDLENIMIVRQEICPREELQYWIELQIGVAAAISMLKEQEERINELMAENRELSRSSYSGDDGNLIL